MAHSWQSTLGMVATNNVFSVHVLHSKQENVPWTFPSMCGQLPGHTLLVPTNLQFGFLHRNNLHLLVCLSSQKRIPHAARH